MQAGRHPQSVLEEGRAQFGQCRWRRTRQRVGALAPAAHPVRQRVLVLGQQAGRVVEFEVDAVAWLQEAYQVALGFQPWRVEHAGRTAPAVVEPGVVDPAEAGERGDRDDQARLERFGLQRQPFDAVAGRRFAPREVFRVAAPGHVGEAGQQQVDARRQAAHPVGGGAAGGARIQRAFAQVQDGAPAALDKAIRVTLAAGEGGDAQVGRQRARLAGGAFGHRQTVAAQLVKQAPVASLAVKEGGDAAKLGAKAAQEGRRCAIGLGARAPYEQRQAAGVEFGDQARAAGGRVDQAPGVVQHAAFEPRVGQQQRVVGAQQEAGVVQESKGRVEHGLTEIASGIVAPSA